MIYSAKFLVASAFFMQSVMGSGYSIYDKAYNTLSTIARPFGWDIQEKLSAIDSKLHFNIDDNCNIKSRLGYLEHDILSTYFTLFSIDRVDKKFCNFERRKKRIAIMSEYITKCDTADSYNKDGNLELEIEVFHAEGCLMYLQAMALGLFPKIINRVDEIYKRLEQAVVTIRKNSKDELSLRLFNPSLAKKIMLVEKNGYSLNFKPAGAMRPPQRANLTNKLMKYLDENIGKHVYRGYGQKEQDLGTPSYQTLDGPRYCFGWFDHVEKNPTGVTDLNTFVSSARKVYDEMKNAQLEKQSEQLEQQSKQLAAMMKVLKGNPDLLKQLQALGGLGLRRRLLREEARAF